MHAHLRRLAEQWFRAYFAASRNSASAATLYAFLAVAPVLLAAVAFFDAAGADTNAFAERLVDHLNLTGTTAAVVRDTFGTASQNALAASFAAIVGFLIWGIGLAPLYRDLYARAWGVERRVTAGDQVRFTVWFFVVTSLLALFVVHAGEVRAEGWAVAAPLWIVVSTAFWLWTPRYLLPGELPLRRLLPGALLASVVIGGANAVSPLFLGGWLKADGEYFGPFGVVVGLLGWAFVMVTISMVCIVFGPVWQAWLPSVHPIRMRHATRDGS